MENNHLTYHVITIGCQMNIADSERIAAYFEDHGYVLDTDPETASIVVLTTCGIRQSAEDRAYGLVNQLRKKNHQSLIITGCLAKRRDVKQRLRGQVDLFMPINDLPNLLELLQSARPELVLSPDEVRALGGEKYLSILPKYQNNYSAYIPIGNGCNNFCSYCVVPYARGREVYRPAEEIMTEVKSLLAKGYREIFLIAQNVNSYRSGTYNFPRLLKEIDSLPGNFWLRFSSSHPKDLSDDLIAVLASSQKVANHLHLAVQSGDDDILEAMNRKYTADHYRELIKKVRAVRPKIAITTDVIVGFPGETEAQFLNSVRLFEDLKFEMAYISQYSPRPGTVSWTMPDNVSRDDKKQREKILNELIIKTSLEVNQQYLGREVVVLVDGLNRRGRAYGKTSESKTVLFDFDSAAGHQEELEKLIGHFVLVKISSAQTFGLEGQFLSLKD
jgi:tRNA-2-methylthio-N6-dimethylallyladenosine synthase